MKSADTFDTDWVTLLGVSLNVILVCVMGYLLTFKLRGFSLADIRNWSPLKRYYAICLLLGIPFLIAYSLFRSSCWGRGQAAFTTCRASGIIAVLTISPVFLSFLYSTTYAYERLSGVLVGLYRYVLLNDQ